MFHFKYILVVLSLFIGSVCLAQPSDQQLAAHYFNNGEFDKAVMYYEKLYNDESTDYYYQFYLKSLVALENYKEAEKLIKKHKKKYPGNASYSVDLGDVYELTGEQNKADDIYRQAIKEVDYEYRSIMELGEAFRSKGKLDLAIEVFELGEKHVKSYPFAIKTAELYGKQGDSERMIEGYLKVAEQFPTYIVSVQNALNALLDFDDPENPTTDLLRTTLLRKIQKSPDNLIYTEMLIWYFIQIKDFDSALIQAKAMDKRLKGSNGEDVLILSRMCRSNKAYDVAAKGYTYVAETYPNGLHTFTAQMELMETLYEKITSSSYTQNDLLQLEQKFKDALDDSRLGMNNMTVRLILKYAHIEGFYLHNTPKAIELLNNALVLPGITENNVALCKLELGDVLLLKGDAWSASLNYMQVEKMFKEDVLGHEAKLRAAKVFYYQGQFEFAQSMLNILKASTSKLIANDAMELSLIITDNMGLDTTPRPMMLFAKADLLIYQNKFDEAIRNFDTITNEYGVHALSDEILFRKYEIEFKQQNYAKCVSYLTSIIEQHSDDILGDDAVYKLAQLYDYYLNEPEKAKEYYKKILFEYTGSIFTADSRNRFRALGGSSTGPDTIRKINKDS